MDMSIKFSLFCKTLFSVFQYRNSVLKKTQILGPNFEPCFWDQILSLVPPVLPLILFFFRKKTISGKQRPPTRLVFRAFLITFVQVSQCQFFHPGYPHYLALNWPKSFSFTESRVSLPYAVTLWKGLDCTV